MLIFRIWFLYFLLCFKVDIVGSSASSSETVPPYQLRGRTVTPQSSDDSKTQQTQPDQPPSEVERLKAIKLRCLGREKQGRNKYPKRDNYSSQENSDASYLSRYTQPVHPEAIALWNEIRSWKPEVKPRRQSEHDDDSEMPSEPKVDEPSSSITGPSSSTADVVSLSSKKDHATNEAARIQVARQSKRPKVLAHDHAAAKVRLEQYQSAEVEHTQYVRVQRGIVDPMTSNSQFQAAWIDPNVDWSHQHTREQHVAASKTLSTSLFMLIFFAVFSLFWAFIEFSPFSSNHTNRYDALYVEF